MQKVCAKGELVKFIDIYHGDYIEDINKVIESGEVAAYLKCWEKTEDPSFQSRWLALKGKMIRGAYDFFHPDMNAISQAKAFVKSMGPLTVNDLPPMLDLETTGGIASDGIREAAFQWLQTVEKLTKRIPIIYTGPYFAEALRLDNRFLRYGLYLAHYGTNCPMVPKPWKNWTAWQTTGKGTVPGMRGDCDMDVFNGSLADLKNYIASTIVK